MSEETELIARIEEILGAADPAVAIRVIDHFTINRRPELKTQRDTPTRMEDPEGETPTKPGFLHTERRIDAAEVLREVERVKAERDKS